MKIDTETELRALIVDDERLAREKMRSLLGNQWNVWVIGEARNIDEAEKMIVEMKPDIVFLDIQMPGGSGFDLLERLEDPPLIIFVTAYDQYAIRAFEVNAIDYLLKPVDPERLKESLERAISRTGFQGEEAAPLSNTDQVFLNTGEKTIFVPVLNIAAIITERNYTNVLTVKGERYMVRYSLRDWERRLPDDTFIILDRSHMINRHHVQSWSSQGRKVEVRLTGNETPILLGRSAYQRFKDTVVAVMAKPGSEGKQ